MALQQVYFEVCSPLEQSACFVRRIRILSAGLAEHDVLYFIVFVPRPSDLPVNEKRSFPPSSYFLFFFSSPVPDSPSAFLLFDCPLVSFFDMLCLGKNCKMLMSANVRRACTQACFTTFVTRLLRTVCVERLEQLQRLNKRQYDVRS